MTKHWHVAASMTQYDLDVDTTKSRRDEIRGPPRPGFELHLSLVAAFPMLYERGCKPEQDLVRHS